MAHGKHKAAKHRLDKKRTPLIRTRTAALVAAPVAASVAVGLGVVAISGDEVDPSAASTSLSGDAVESRELRASRAKASASVAARAAVPARTAAPKPKPQPTRAARPALRPMPKVTGRLWAVKDLNLRLQPSEDAGIDGVFGSGRQLAVTGVQRDGYAQVVHEGAVRWVTAEYLSEKKEIAPEELPAGGHDCDRDLGSKSGLTGGAISVWDSVCALFPEIETIGGWAARGEHSGGRALDIMTDDSSVGDRLADYLRANADEFNLSNVIWKQRIWSAERSGEGWRGMSDRGSATANHLDHVHALVN